jgi:hypothetical protein
MAITKEEKLKIKRETKLGISVNGHHHLFTVQKRERPDHCELCNESCEILDWHHWDPNNLNKGIWVCKKCHPLAEYLDGYEDKEYLERFKDKYLSFKSNIESNPPETNFNIPRDTLVEVYKIIFDINRHYISVQAAWYNAIKTLKLDKYALDYQLKQLSEKELESIRKEASDNSIPLRERNIP